MASNGLYDVSTEGEWIASAIAHPEYLRIENNVRPNFFYSKTNQCLVWAIQTLAITNNVDNIDALNLQTVISSNHAVEKIVNGAIPDLQSFIDMSRNAARSTYNEFKLVEDRILTLSFRRELQTFSHQLSNECENPNASLEQLDSMCNEGVDRIVTKYIFGSNSYEIGQEIDDAWKAIVSKRTKNGFGIPYLIPRLNEFASLVPGELDVLTAKTGKGKSSFFMCQALYAALTLHVGTLIIDSEITTEVWLPRALASISGVKVWKIRTGQYDDAEKAKIKQAMDVLKKAHICHYYLPEFDRLQVEQLCRKWVNKGYGLIILDYIKPVKALDASSLSQDLGMQADFMKSISSRLNVAVLAGIQQNKVTGEVADSQKVERYADLLMKWQEKTSEEIAANPHSGNFYISIAKNRNGSCTDENDYIDVNFQRDVMRIGEAERHTNSEDVNPFGEN
jgi:replicative DNA helicase